MEKRDYRNWPALTAGFNLVPQMPLGVVKAVENSQVIINLKGTPQGAFLRLNLRTNNWWFNTGVTLTFKEPREPRFQKMKSGNNFQFLGFPKWKL